MIDIIIFEFHLGFVDRNITKHGNSLASFDKSGVTLRAADLNLAFSFWNTDLLFAWRTFVNVVCLALCYHVTLPVEKWPDAACHLQIFLILGGSFVSIFGKHPEIRIDDTGPCQPGKDSPMRPSCNQHKDQGSPDGKFAKGINTISSVHKTYKSVF